MLDSLLATTAMGRTFVNAPDIGEFYAEGCDVRIKTAVLLQQPGEPESTDQLLMTFQNVEGYAGTKVTGAELAEFTARMLNHARVHGRRLDRQTH